jgi:hypothetical protein
MERIRLKYNDQVYLCMRVLLCRLSAHNLASFWPTILTELVNMARSIQSFRYLTSFSFAYLSMCSGTFLRMARTTWRYFCPPASSSIYCWCYRHRSSKCKHYQLNVSNMLKEQFSQSTVDVCYRHHRCCLSA